MVVWSRLCAVIGTLSLTACGGSLSESSNLLETNVYPVAEHTALNYSGPARTPVEWMAFCSKYPFTCLSAENATITLSAAQWDVLVSVNSIVNQRVTYSKDAENSGRRDQWDLLNIDLANVRGDCEDTALTKRAMLIARGFDPGALKLALVQRPPFDSTAISADHAVLVIEAEQGSYVLDSLDYRIRPVSETEYRFLKVHAPTAEDPNRWAWVNGAHQIRTIQ